MSTAGGSADDLAAVREALEDLDGHEGDAYIAFDRLAARLQATEKDRDELWDKLAETQVALQETEAREAVLRETLDWIEAEPEDPAKVQARARAALAEKPENDEAKWRSGLWRNTR